MSYILTADQIRQWDQYTIEHEPISSIELMERAALQCSQWLMQQWDTDRPFILFCGNGNNGGDGLAIARHLLEYGYHVSVLIDDAVKKSNDNLTNLKELSYLYKSCIHSIESEITIPSNAIIIDALVGTGLKQSLKGKEQKWVTRINSLPNTKVCIDLPSGLSADQFLQTESIVKGDFTLTFQVYKKSFLFPETGIYCGKIILLNIGLHPDFLKLHTFNQLIIDKEILHSFYKKRTSFSHKGTFGHSLLFVGSEGKMGACILAAKGCLRSGTGLLTLLIPSDQIQIAQVAVPEAMTINYEKNNSLPRLDAYSSIGAGSGIGQHETSIQLISQLMTESSLSMVLDADALNIIANNPELLHAIPKESILTPHPKEFERLFGESENSYLRHELQLQKSVELGLFILLKGRYTCITTPDGKSYFNTTGNPGMGTGGSGDVLTGIITGLYAQYHDMLEAGLLGVYLHGLAGDIAAQKKSEESLIASDIIDQLGQAFKDSFYNAE